MAASGLSPTACWHAALISPTVSLALLRLAAGNDGFAADKGEVP